MATGGLVLIIVGGIFSFFKRKYHTNFIQVTLGKEIDVLPANEAELQRHYWEYIFISLPFVFPMISDDNHKGLKHKVIINGLLATLCYVSGILCLYLKIKYPDLSRF